MTRSEFDDIRAHIAAEGRRPGSDLLQLAGELLDDLEQVRMREVTLRSYYLRLLTAARATVAAEAAGDPAPLTFLAHELAKHAQLPSGEPVERILSDAGRTQALVPRADEPGRRGPRQSGGRYCGGMSRKLRG
ncbi:hypothetical protein ACFHYQ_28585 [Sphaerimonospora cavernae]|uniref:DUF222 domain-containing protein n=1 Tax=Sphaerimonospora cavernae TaxID=1740611 RepID=A0ABV6UDL3_9ACTN